MWLWPESCRTDASRKEAAVLFAMLLMLLLLLFAGVLLELVTAGEVSSSIRRASDADRTDVAAAGGEADAGAAKLSDRSARSNTVTSDRHASCV